MEHSYFTTYLHVATNQDVLLFKLLSFWGVLLTDRGVLLLATLRYFFFVLLLYILCTTTLLLFSPMSPLLKRVIGMTKQSCGIFTGKTWPFLPTTHCPSNNFWKNFSQEINLFWLPTVKNQSFKNNPYLWPLHFFVGNQPHDSKPFF